ncbi:MAG: TonB-dependent receptor [Myxococcales bacterium]|nr:TonB-dependent receptor [Myxococcales bacterium]
MRFLLTSTSGRSDELRRAPAPARVRGVAPRRGPFGAPRRGPLGGTFTTFAVFVALVALAAGRLAAQPVEGPIEGPIEGPVEGPLEGPIEGSVEGGAASAADLGDTLAEGDSGITGVVLDHEANGAPMAGVSVELVGRGRRITTGPEGRFQLRLPPGSYTLRIVTDFYLPVRLRNVEVERGEITYLPDVELRMDSSTMGEASVTTYRVDTNTAATQLQVRQQSAGVRDAVSSEEIRRAGDGSAGSAARRVVATTIVGGRYLYVRGLGGRYVSVTLNDALLPALDPYSAGVQLDLFPSEILSSLAVLKSYLPELPGAFGGGALQISLAEPPDQFEVRASLGLGVNTQTTWRDAPVYRGGRWDLFGHDDGSRALPEGLRERPLTPAGVPDSNERRELSQQFNDDFRVRRRMVGLMPIEKLGLSVGHRLRFGRGMSLGVLAAGGWTLERQRQNERLVTPRVDPDDPNERAVLPRDDLRRESYEQEARLYALGVANLELGDDHEVTYTTLFNQIGIDYTAIDQGIIESLDGSEDSMRGRLQFNTRRILFHQLRGRHYLGSARLTWHAETTRANRSEPDTRDFRYKPNDIGSGDPWPTNPWGADRRWIWQPNLPDDGQRLFMELDQRDFGGGLNFLYDWRQAGVFKVSAGLAAHRAERTFDLRRFNYRSTLAPEDPSLTLRPPEELFRRENFGTNIAMREITGANDAFVATEELFAAYLGTQLEPHARLRLFAGARVESFRQTLLPGSNFGDQLSPEALAEMTVTRTNVDVLPTASARVMLREAMFVRAAYAVTVARPTAREISGFLLPNFVENRNEFGSPSVRRTRIQSVDVRWEWFPSALEVLSLTAFAKFFEDPIELVVLNPNRIFSYQNIDRARNFGLELEGRVSLGRIHSALDRWNAGANLTLVRSEAILDEQQARAATNPERPLSFQAPWVVNASIGYEGDALSVYAYYNVFGPRLEEVGTDRLPDTYRQPVHRLDLIGRWRLRDGVTLSFSVKNLLHQREQLVAQGLLVRGFQPGTSVSASLGWTFR